jgi:hypothetical protein
LIKDILMLMYTFLNMFSVSTHPNFIDMSGKVLTKMFVDTDTGGLIDKEKSRLAVLYFTLIAYAAVFIFVAYVASENWFYFLVYPYSEDIMTNTVDEDGKNTYTEWSLAAWWAYYEKKQPTIFGVFHALFYTTTAIDSLVRRLRQNTRGTADYMSPLLHIGIFLGIYYLFNYWTTVTDSPVFDIIILIFMTFAVLRIVIMTHGSVGFTAPSAYYPPSLLSFVISLIKGFVLWTINYSLISIGKIAIYVYFMFISFAFISFSETKRKERGMIGRYFDTVEEMGKYHLLNSQKDYDKVIPPTWFAWSWAALLLELNWLSVSVIIIFLIMFFSLLAESGNNVQHFIPIFYFIVIFWGIAGVKIIINCAAWFLKKRPALEKEYLSSHVSTLNENPLSQTGKVNEAKYNIGINKGYDILKDTGKHVWNDAPKDTMRNLRELRSDLKYGFDTAVQNPATYVTNTAMIKPAAYVYDKAIVPAVNTTYNYMKPKPFESKVPETIAAINAAAEAASRETGIRLV